MECENVRVLQRVGDQPFVGFALRPDSARKRLARADFPRPTKDRFQQRQGFVALRVVFALSRVVTRRAIARLVIQVPQPHARIILKPRQHALDVRFQSAPLRGIVNHRCTGRLDPAGVVLAGFGVTLLAERELLSPAVIEEDKHRLNAMRISQREILIHPITESSRVLLPEQVVQIHPHDCHAQRFRATQLAVNGLRVKRVSLPHLQLIDRGAGIEIRPHKIGLVVIPGLCPILGPSLSTHRIDLFLWCRTGSC